MKEWEGQEYNPVVYYKLQGQSDKLFKNQDFMIVLQTEHQKQMVEKFGQYGVCVDCTHGTNMYDFMLTTLLVVDEFGEGQPLTSFVHLKPQNI